MRSWGEQGDTGGSAREGPRWARPSKRGSKLRIFGWELRLLSPNERATRDLLADVVYRVPPEWLDQIIEARLAHLDR